MTEQTPEPLGLADYDMEPHNVGTDLVWGLKAFHSDYYGDSFIWEMQYRVPGDETVVYVREKTAVGAQSLDAVARSLNIFGRLLTEPEYRAEVRDHFVRTHTERGDTDGAES